MVYDVTQGCTHCGGCIIMCPAKAITMDRRGAHIDPKKCLGCGLCYINCASEAITPIQAENLKNEE